MLDLAERLSLPDVACVAPAAPRRSWHPHRYIAPRKTNEPHLSRALGQVADVLADLARRGVPAERTVLGGFSQGAGLACEAVARQPRRLGGLAVLSGGPIGEDEDERVRRTAGRARRERAEVDLRIFPPGAHAVREEELAALRTLVLPARGAPVGT